MPNFTQILQKTYAEVPHQVTVYLLHSQQPEQIFAYRDLINHAAQYSLALQKAGIQPGEVVILILQHGIDLVASFFGAILHGSIPSIMPFLTEKLLPDHYRSSLASLFEITTPAAVITYPEFVDEVRQASTGTSVRKLIISEQVSQSPQQGGSASVNFTTLGGLYRSPDDIVLLQHSSGTTGLQKGVALSHRAVFNQLESYSRALQLNSQDVIVSWLPLYHDMGLIAGFIMPILTRVPLVLMSPFDWVRSPYRLLQAISKFRGTLCWLPNFAYNFCAQKIRDRDLDEVDLSSLRAVINCSEPIHWKSHQMFLERFQPYGFQPQALATSYAMAENVFAVTQGGIDRPITIDCVAREGILSRQIAEPIHHPTHPLDDNSIIKDEHIIRMVSCGKPIEGTNIKVIDKDGKELPERHIGEIALLSNCMLTGYYHRPDLTEKAFLDGWYLTGDLGYIANGELYVTGRKKDLIIVGGKNIYPQDLERIAGEVKGIHPGRVVAFGVFNEQIGTEEVIIIAEIDEQSLDELGGRDNRALTNRDRLAEDIRRRVAQGSEVTPREVYVVERNWLIKTSSGKIARNANRERYLTELAPHVTAE